MNPLRLAGALALVACGGCTGNAVSLRMQAHLDALEQVLALLQELEQEISFRRTDLNLLCKRLVREGRIRTEQGSLSSALPPQVLSQEEAACFRECFSGLGRSEADEECRRLALYRKRFEHFLTEREKRTQEQRILVQKLGFAVGLAFGILFL